MSYSSILKEGSKSMNKPRLGEGCSVSVRFMAEPREQAAIHTVHPGLDVIMSGCVSLCIRLDTHGFSLRGPLLQALGCRRPPFNGRLGFCCLYLRVCELLPLFVSGAILSLGGPAVPVPAATVLEHISLAAVCIVPHTAKLSCTPLVEFWRWNRFHLSRSKKQQHFDFMMGTEQKAHGRQRKGVRKGMS